MAQVFRSPTTHVVSRLPAGSAMFLLACGSGPSMPPLTSDASSSAAVTSTAPVDAARVEETPTTFEACAERAESTRAACDRTICDQDVGRCFEAAIGRETARDATGAARLFERTCERETKGCANLGAMVASGSGVAKDRARALGLFGKACDAKDSVGCVALGGELLTATDPVEKDPKRGFDLVKRACDAGALEGCVMVGVAYEGGISHGTFTIAQNFRDAMAHYRRACDGKIGEGCAAMGVMYLKGRGVKKDVAQAVKSLETACRLSTARACNLAGMLTMNEDSLRTDGVVEANTRAVALFRQGCDGDHGASCANFGGAQAAGVGGLTEDEAAAKKSFEKACKLGAREGCERLEEMK